MIYPACCNCRRSFQVETPMLKGWSYVTYCKITIRRTDNKACADYAPAFDGEVAEIPASVPEPVIEQKSRTVELADFIKKIKKKG